MDVCLFFFFANVLKPVGFIFNFALFFMFSFTSLSKVHLKVEYRDWHAAVLFGAISNMLASLKKKKVLQTTFQHFWKSSTTPLSAQISTFYRQCKGKKTFTKASIYFHFIYKTISLFFGKYWWHNIRSILLCLEEGRLHESTFVELIHK